jgi:predicted dehydrogenase
VRESEPVLLVGLGRRGRQWLYAVSSRRDCQLAGVVDPDEGARAHAASQRLPTWSTLEEALKVLGAPTVVIASPPELHAAQTLCALRAGCAVLVEKPLALSLEDAHAIAQAATAADLPVVVGHNFRHRAQERAIRRGLDAPELGELRAMAILTARPALDAPCPAPEHAPLWDLGVHHLDLLRLRTGCEPDWIEARCANERGAIGLSAHLEWEGRAVADYWLREGGQVYHHAEWLEGTRAAVRVTDGRVSLVTSSSRPRRLRAPRGPDPKQVLLGAVLARKAAGMDARDAIGTIAMVEAALQSLRLQRPVRVAELAPGSGTLK